MPTLKRTLGCTAILTTLATAAAGQDPPRHHRFWWGFGLGGGWQTWEWSLGTAGGRSGAAYIRMGGTVNQHVLFGAEVHTVFAETRPGQDAQRTNIAATALVYPGSRGGWYLKGGFGVADAEGPSQVGEGVGFTAGTSVDFRIGRNLYVTPDLTVLTQFLALETNASVAFTLGLTWH